MKDHVRQVLEANRAMLLSLIEDDEVMVRSLESAKERLDERKRQIAELDEALEGVALVA